MGFTYYWVNPLCRRIPLPGNNANLLDEIEELGNFGVFIAVVSKEKDRLKSGLETKRQSQRYFKDFRIEISISKIETIFKRRFKFPPNKCNL